jgi:Ca-activated chloride channel family protein
MTKHTAVLLLAVACATGIASNRLSGQRRGETVIETEVISVPVTVNDRRGRFIPGLKQQDFEVLEDNIPQELTSFTIEESGIAAELLIDVSGSMSYRLEEAKRAAQQFVQQMTPKDVAKIVQFDDRVTELSDFSSDKAVLAAAVNKAYGVGATALYNAISRALDDLAARRKVDEAEQRHRAIVLLTDGDDTSSAINEDEVLSKAGRVDALVYALSLDRSNGLPVTDGPSAVFLNALARQSGGQLQFPELANLGKFYRDLSDELRHQYVLGYVPAGSKAGARWHAITVLVKNRKDYRLRYRTGYFATGSRSSQ